MAVGKGVIERVSIVVLPVQVVTPVLVRTVRTENISTIVVQVRTVIQASVRIVIWTGPGSTLRIEREG